MERASNFKVGPTLISNPVIVTWSEYSRVDDFAREDRIYFPFLHHAQKQWGKRVQFSGIKRVIHPWSVCCPQRTDDYAAAFLELLRYYRWRSVTFLCQAESVTDQATRRDFQAVLWGREDEYYDMYQLSADLAQEDHRLTALTRSKSHTNRGSFSQPVMLYFLYR